MCGLAITINGTTDEINRMGNAIKHRGVTHDVTHFDNVKVWFSHLPITDLDAPKQPFGYDRYAVWLNGFISNYRDIASEYRMKLNTDCDTEVLAMFIELTGFSQLHKLNGFFSVAVYDFREKKLHCFTDRYGCKQLYKYHYGDTTYIASEVKALRAVVSLQICPVAAEDWLYSLGVMTDDTIYEGVERVWCLPFNKQKPLNISYEVAKSRLTYLLNQSFSRNKIHGLNDGVFLSGGVDSGILAARMNPDYCFSMDYQNELSEIENIKLNSRGIHLTMVCNHTLFSAYQDKTIEVLDDLKAGSSYTNLALTELASKFCTVLYSGAGSDEIFDGYTHRYNRPLADVIRRTELVSRETCEEITHKEYDWRFLRAVLVVEDRMSGFNTMETRYPFLDNDLVEFVLSLPPEYRKDKRILKDVSGLCPEVTSGKKRGWANDFMTNDTWASFALSRTRATLSKGFVR